MPTSNIPLTYTCKMNGTVHLYIAVYGTSTAPGFPTQGTIADAVIIFNITTGGTGTVSHFKHYSFAANSLTDIQVHCSTHIRTILIADLDNVTALPTQSGDQAFDVPYAYTQMVQDADHFEAEMVIYAESPGKKFKCEHSGPLNVDGDTESNITIDTDATTVTVFSDSEVFNVTKVRTTDGAHTVTFTEGNNPPKRRKSKTKNKNHSITPSASRIRGNKKP